jgi:hypothetical protein
VSVIGVPPVGQLLPLVSFAWTVTATVLVPSAAADEGLTLIVEVTAEGPGPELKSSVAECDIAVPPIVPVTVAASDVVGLANAGAISDTEYVPSPLSVAGQFAVQPPGKVPAVVESATAAPPVVRLTPLAFFVWTVTATTLVPSPGAEDGLTPIVEVVADACTVDEVNTTDAVFFTGTGP